MELTASTFALVKELSEWSNGRPSPTVQSCGLCSKGDIINIHDFVVLNEYRQRHQPNDPGKS
jgi:hypothetical protein